jgi:hypothetical protein
LGANLYDFSYNTAILLSSLSPGERVRVRGIRYFAVGTPGEEIKVRRL